MATKMFIVEGGPHLYSYMAFFFCKVYYKVVNNQIGYLYTLINVSQTLCVLLSVSSQKKKKTHWKPHILHKRKSFYTIRVLMMITDIIMEKKISLFFQWKVLLRQKFYI